MMYRFRTLAMAMITASFALTTPMFAQDTSGSNELSVEDITKAFKKQKTRGLVLVPNTAAPAAEAASAAATAPAAQSTTLAVAAEEYNPVDEATQVSVQIAFDFDSATLRTDQKSKLANMCASMKLMEGTVFQIIGHTDSSGSADYNERLSLLRAQEVRRHMIGECGIDASVLNAIGLGETAPLDSENPRADSNRRVEFQALG